MTHTIIGLAVLLLTLTGPVQAGPAIEQAQQQYQGQGAGPFSATRGKALWLSTHPSAEDGKVRDCGVCHGTDLSQSGSHARTGKTIKAMAPSVNPDSLGDLKKIEKWFTRNCKWTWGHECSAQEKGDLLQYLSSQ